MRLLALGLGVMLATLVPGVAPAEAQEDDPLRRWRFFMEQRRYPGVENLAGRLQMARRQTLLRPALTAPPAGAGILAGTVWESLGPERIPWFDTSTGRATAIALHPTDPQTLYVGGAQAGIWKTTDGGASWTPLTDDQCSLAMGSLAIDPVDPEIVYGGTGEQHFSGDSYYGCGVLRSSNGGSTWTHLDRLLPPGAAGGVRTSRIRIDPGTAGSTTATRVYAATDAGFMISDDSGRSWRTTHDGIVTDLLMDPRDPSVLVIGVYGDGVFRSDDAGESWTGLPLGVPPDEGGRVNLALAPSDPEILYAAVHNREDGQLQGVHRSDDGGGRWSELSASGASCGRQCWYDFALAVDPENPEIVYFGGIGLFRSDDGGSSFTDITGGIHVDQHLIVVDPRTPARVFVVNDGGIYRSDDRGGSWTSLNTDLAMTQFYPGVSLHPRDPSVILGGTQDNGTLQYDGTSTWPVVIGGDGGFTAINPLSPDIRYGETQWGGGSGGPRRSVAGGSWFQIVDGIDFSDPAIFIPPLVMDPYEPSVLYFGTDRVYRTTDRGDGWTPISPHFQGRRVTSIAPALTDGDVVYAAAVGGVQVTENGGETWPDRSAGLPNRYFTDVAVHPDDPSIAYVTASGFGSGHVFRTEDFGRSWSDISTGLPDLPVNAVLLDPDDPGILYIGTDLGVWAGTEEGGWQPLGEGMPNVAAFDLAVETATGLLVAATHGRGMFGLPVHVSPRVRLRVPRHPVAVTTFDPVGSVRSRIGIWGEAWYDVGWSAEARVPWLVADPREGTGRTPVQWRVDALTLPPGVHRGEIVVSLPAGAASDTLPVTVEVEASDTLLAPTSSRSTRVLVGDGEPVPDSLVLEIAGVPSARQWSATHGEAGWLEILTPSGGDGDTLRWVRRPGGLEAGIYVDTLEIVLDRAFGSPARLVDTLSVEPPVTVAPVTTARSGVSLAGLDLERPDSVRIDLVGFGADTARWEARHGSQSWLTLRTEEGARGDLLRWVRRADALDPGVYVDTLTLRPRGAPERTTAVVDTFRVAGGVLPDDAASELLDGDRLDVLQRELLDRLGNDDGVFNLGDVLAWLERCARGGCGPVPAGGGGR